MTPMEKNADTQQRLLESACELFAEKGYPSTTLADVCDRARANKAAVNYYFRSKENLYAEAWRLEFERSFKAHPLDGDVAADAPPEERLRAHILSMAQRITDPKAHEFDIIEKERANPTGLLVEIMRTSIQPAHEHMGAIVRELLGPKASEQQAALCQRSIVAQCMDIFIHERPGRKVHGPPPMNLGIQDIAEHIVRFSLAGIRDTRRRLENGELDDGE